MASATLPKLSELSPEELEFLARIPTIQPPTGATSDFRNPPSNGKPLVAVDSLLFALTILFAANRVHVKTRITRKCSWDDCEHMSAVPTILCHTDFGTVTLLIGFVSSANPTKRLLTY